MHSSSQAELAALRLGFCEALRLGFFSRIILNSDSQSALLWLRRFGGSSSLALEARDAVTALEACTEEFWIWWTPSHAGLVENHLADEMAEVVAQELADLGSCDIPLYKAALKTQLSAYYFARAIT